MVRLTGESDAFQYKCINCNSYFTFDDLTSRTSSTKKDLVEVVRCKDCKWYDPFPMCGLLGTSDIREDFFCADGKEKDNGKEEG